jgi:hypothetical protein
MAAAEKPLVYLILGAAGSGRRAVLTDLLEDGLVAGDRPAVMLATTEAADEADAKLPALTRWSWANGQIAGELPRAASHIFFISEGRENPVEQIEVFVAWLEAQGGQIARVLTVVNCQLAEKHPALLANKWMSDFQTHFKKQYVPCLFEFVKDGRVKNPALTLDPQPRRMSHVFDDESEWIFKTTEGEIIDEEQETEGDEEVEATREIDEYFVRDAANRRVKRLPDIRPFL